MERVRYFVQSYDAEGDVVGWNSPGARPYLMVDRGLRSADGAPLLDVVAPDVEDLQVSYVFPLAAADEPGGGIDAWGRASTTRPRASTWPLGSYPPTPRHASRPVRTTHYPSNIRAVRAAVVVRSPNQDPTWGTRSSRPPAIDPRWTPATPGYLRTVFETSVAIPNMEARAPFFPTIVPTTDASAGILNVGGG